MATTASVANRQLLCLLGQASLQQARLCWTAANGSAVARAAGPGTPSETSDDDSSMDFGVSRSRMAALQRNQDRLDSLLDDAELETELAELASDDELAALEALEAQMAQ